MTADPSRRTWSNPPPEVVAASHRAQRLAKRLQTAEQLLQEADNAATANPTAPPDAKYIARIRVFLATT